MRVGNVREVIQYSDFKMQDTQLFFIKLKLKAKQ